MVVVMLGRARRLTSAKVILIIIIMMVMVVGGETRKRFGGDCGGCGGGGGGSGGGGSGCGVFINNLLRDDKSSGVDGSKHGIHFRTCRLKRCRNICRICKHCCHICHNLLISSDSHNHIEPHKHIAGRCNATKVTAAASRCGCKHRQHNDGNLTGV